MWKQMLSPTFQGSMISILKLTVHALISQVAQGNTLMEDYPCNTGVKETPVVQKDQKVMLVEDWVVAQSKDPMIREIEYLINTNKLKGVRCTHGTHRLKNNI